MTATPDDARWEHVKGGVIQAPHPACPACGTTWTRRGEGRPATKAITCGWSLQRHHTAWACPEASCRTWTAEGCVDVARRASSTDAGPLNLDLARRRLRDQRQVVIDGALMSTEASAPRLMRRGRSLEGTPVRVVVALPAAGPWWSHPAPSVLLTSRATFLDDEAWAAVVAGLSA